MKYCMLLNLGTLDFLLLELHPSLVQPHLVLTATRAVKDMVGLVQPMVTDIGTAIETRVVMKKEEIRMISLQNRLVESRVAIKETIQRRVLHTLPGRAYLTVNMVCEFLVNLVLLTY